MCRVLLRLMPAGANNNTEAIRSRYFTSPRSFAEWMLPQLWLTVMTSQGSTSAQFTMDASIEVQSSRSRAHRSLAAGAEAAAEPDSVKADPEGDESKPAQAAEQAAAEEQPAHAPNGISTEEAVRAESAQADSGPAVAAVVPEEAPQSYDEQLGQLDLQLTYLWRVHGVDYYAGVEHAEPEAYDACAGSKRVLRCPRPEEGEQPIKEEGELLSVNYFLLFSHAAMEKCPEPQEVGGS